MDTTCKDFCKTLKNVHSWPSHSWAWVHQVGVLHLDLMLDEVGNENGSLNFYHMNCVSLWHFLSVHVKILLCCMIFRVETSWRKSKIWKLWRYCRQVLTTTCTHMHTNVVFVAFVPDLTSSYPARFRNLPDLGTPIRPEAVPDLGITDNFFWNHRTIHPLKLVASTMLSIAIKKHAV